jgi:4-amino-4-deoxy-L-arabinose transferase-like glycosyltransferase
MSFFLEKYLIYFYIVATCVGIWAIKIVLLGIDTFPSGDNLTYASIARNMVENGSISHISALPSDIYLLGEFPQYDTSQPIGLPIFLVPFFIFFGVNNFAIMASSLTLYIVNALLIFIMSGKLFDKRIAITSTFLFIFSSSYYHYINSGLTEPLLISILMIIAYTQFFIISKYKGLLIGILLYALYLTKSAMAIFIFPYFIVHWFLYEDRSLKYLFGIFITLSILSVPLMVRGALLEIATYSQKSGLVDLIFNGSSDRTSWYFGLRSLELPSEWLEPYKYASENYTIYLKRYASTLYSMYLKMYGANYLFSGSVLFCGYLLVQSKNRLESVFKLFTLGILGLLILGFSIGWPIERYLLPAAPFLIIAIASYSVPRITYGRKSYTVILLLVAMQTPWVGFLVKDVYSYDSQLNYTQLGDFVANNTKYGDIVISNAPVLIGWYSNRKSVLYPNSIDEINALHRINPKINTIVLTKELKTLFRSNVNQNLWDDIYNNNSQKIGDRFCLTREYTNKKNTYKALIYQLCEK